MELSELLIELARLNISHTEYCPLAPYTSFKIGGPARIAVFPQSEEEAVRVFSLLRGADYPMYPIGNGSNLLIADEGLDGVTVILTGLHTVTRQKNRLTAGAGVPLTKLACEAADASLTGLEFAYGIPGTVGGGVFMNAGAYGGEMKQVVLSTTYFDLTDGKIKTLSAEEHEFDYRHSYFMEHPSVILSVTVELKEGNEEEIRAVMKDLMDRRRDKQPLNYPSAGSVFKRGTGYFAGKLIEDAGLKGTRIGGAAVSEKHAGFIVNEGGATAEDVKQLIAYVQDSVREKYGIGLVCEVRFLGC